MSRVRRSAVTLHGGNPAAPRNLPLSDAGGAGDPVPLCVHCQSPVRNKSVPGQAICPRCASNENVWRTADAFLAEGGMRPLDGSGASNSPEEGAQRAAAGRAMAQLGLTVLNIPRNAPANDDGPLALIQAKRAKQAKEIATRLEVEQKRKLEAHQRVKDSARRKALDKKRQKAGQVCTKLERLIADALERGANNTVAGRNQLADLRQSLAAAQRKR